MEPYLTAPDPGAILAETPKLSAGGEKGKNFKHYVEKHKFC